MSWAASSCASEEARLRAERRSFGKPGAEALPVQLFPVELRKESSSVVAARAFGRQLVLIADEDESAIVLHEPDTGETLLQAELWCAPHQLLFAPNGELFATHPRCNAVSRYQLKRREDDGAFSLHETARRDVALEPVALAIAPSADTLFGVSAWGRTLFRFRLPSLEPLPDVTLPREPRAVSVSDDGARVWVAHAVGGILSEVNLSTDDVVEHSLSASSRRLERRPFKRMHDVFFDDFAGSTPLWHHHRGFAQVVSFPSALPATQGFALAAVGNRVWVPQVFSNPGELGQIAHGYGAVGSPLPATLQDVAVFDVQTGTSNREGRMFSIPNGWSHPSKNVCRLPRATALDAQTGSLLVACLDSGRVLTLDARDEDPARSERASYRVPDGPSGIALDTALRRAYVWSRFARTVSVLDLDGAFQRPNPMVEAGLNQRFLEVPEGYVLTSRPLPDVERSKDAEQVFVGMLLFHDSENTALSDDGRACASCHPAGRDDGLRWRTAGALTVRQTPMLDGRIQGTAPYGWEGAHATLEEHLENTIKTRLHGTGLAPEAMAALTAYVRSLPGPPPAVQVSELANAAELASIERGEAVYHREDVGCADCHDDDGGVDGMQHAVAGVVKTDTPSLRYIAGAAPFFHDGKYATLDDVIQHTQGTMGQTTPLQDEERADLLAFLRTL